MTIFQKIYNFVFAKLTCKSCDTTLSRHPEFGYYCGKCGK